MDLMRVASHEVAEENSPRREPWEKEDKTISPEKVGRSRCSTRASGMLTLAEISWPEPASSRRIFPPLLGASMDHQMGEGPGVRAMESGEGRSAFLLNQANRMGLGARTSVRFRGIGVSQREAD